jgi:hypothetical protein
MKFQIGESTSSWLDGLARPQISFRGRNRSAFLIWGCMGLGVASIVTVVLAIQLSLSPIVMIFITGAAVSTFFVLALLIKLVTGEEQHVHYHHEVAILVLTAALLWISDNPILPYLDLTVVGKGIFLAVGRIGCFLVGCCHGQPCSWGVRYRQEHADAGFPYYYVGVRVFPSQLLESVWVLVITTFGIFLLLSGQPFGTCFSWYIVSYGVGRFFMEFFRGDPERPYLCGFSEAQWTSVVLIALVMIAELAGFLPLHLTQPPFVVTVVLVMTAIALKRSLEPRATRQLLNPRHVGELAAALQLITDLAAEPDSTSLDQVQIARTSLGVQVSASRLRSTSDRTYHYAFSHCDGGMTEKTARLLGLLIVRLRAANNSTVFVPGTEGVFHLLINPRKRNGLVHS